MANEIRKFQSVSMENKQNILLDMIDDFYQDFSFSDMSRIFVDNKVLTECECDEVYECGKDKLGQEKENVQIDKMMFILIYRHKYIDKFLNSLQRDYKWLYDKFYSYDVNKTGSVSARVDMYRKAIDDSELPQIDEYNIHRCRYLWAIQQNLNILDASTIRYLVVHGNIGSGKGWLVSDACNNFLVVKKMDYAIFYVNVSKCKTPELILHMLNRLRVILRYNEYDRENNSSSMHVENEIVELKIKLKTIIASKYRNCLLILSNVPSKEVIKAFDLNCKTLVITRSTDTVARISSEKKIMINISKGFTKEESIELFRRTLKKIDFPREAYEIHDRCNGNPFVMSLIAKNIADFGDGSTAKFKEWNYKMSQNNHFDEGFRIPIEQNLHQLPENLREMYNCLVIFTDKVNIPINVIHQYWEHGEKHDTEVLIKKFHSCALLEIVKSQANEVVCCSLHYLYYVYLTKHLDAQTKLTFHKQLVQSYSIPEVLERQYSFPNDGYFHYNIGYHLKEAQMYDLFPKLFLNIDFLEQKIRFTGLPNTIGDLRQYQDLITCKDPMQVQLLDEMIEFLMNVEEYIIKSEDSSLLNYALATEKLVSRAARAQLPKYKNTVLMIDYDHSHKHRQIVKTPKKPMMVKFKDSNSALISCADSSMQLIDLSVNYSVEPIAFVPHEAEVLSMQSIDSENLISLDRNGCLRLWSMKTTAVTQRRSSSVEKVKPRKCLQKLKNDRVKCFCLTDDGKIIAGTMEGKIVIYEKTKSQLKGSTLGILTRHENIRWILKLRDRHIMVIEAEKDMYCTIYNLRNSGSIGSTRISGTCVNVHYLEIGKLIWFVFADKIMQLRLEADGSIDSKNVRDEVLYKVPENNEILCSAVTADNKYLMLGTRKGIVVYSRYENTVIWNKNVSDEIIGIDVWIDDTHEYLISSIAKNSGYFINLYGFTADNSAAPSNDVRENRELAKNLFDFYLNEGGELTAAAVDSQNHIYFRKSRDKFHQPLNSVKIENPITALARFKTNFVIGCENGNVVRLHKDDTFTETLPFMHLHDPISFLKCIGDNIVIAGTRKTYKINGRPFEGDVVECFLVHGYIIIIRRDCSFKIYDINKKADVVVYNSASNFVYGASSFDSNYLIIGTKNGAIYCYEIKSFIDKNPQINFIDFTQQLNSSVESISLSADSCYFAAGLADGTIHLFNIDQRQVLKTLFSHNSSVSFLEFSPWTHANSPIILVSLGEQIVFWNITHVINNVTQELEETKNIRGSQRFRKNRLSSSSMNIQVMPNNNNNPWFGKIGRSATKPWLISCTKLVGSSAGKLVAMNDFTEFLTIDNEGNVYYFHMFDNNFKQDQLHI